MSSPISQGQPDNGPISGEYGILMRLLNQNWKQKGENSQNESPSKGEGAKVQGERPE